MVSGDDRARESERQRPLRPGLIVPAVRPVPIRTAAAVTARTAGAKYRVASLTARVCRLPDIVGLGWVAVFPSWNRVVPKPTDASGRHGRLAGTLAGLAVVLAALALVLSYAGRAVLQAEPFADRVVATLKAPAVQNDVADHLTDVLVRQAGGDLVAVRPVVRAVTGAIVGSGAFAALFRRAALELHASLVSGHGGAILVTVADAGVLVQGALERLAPDAAGRVGADQLARLGSLRPGGAVLTVIRVARRIYTIAWALAAASILLALLALGSSRDRRSTAQQLGIGLAIGGLAIAALYAFGGDLAAHLAASGRAGVVTAVWSAFGHGLLVQSLLVAGAGAILAAVAAASERAPSSPTAAERRLSTRVRLGRSLLAITGGAVIVLEPGAAVTIAVSVAGLVLVYIGVRGVIEVAVGSLGARQPGRLQAGRIVSRLAAPAVAVGAVVVAAAIVLAGGGDGAAAVTPATCNGSAALCDRPLNDVAFAATHNSMASVTIPTWLFGQQDGTIQQQLDYGIRGLLIDTYFGFPVKGGVRTDLSSLPKRQLAVEEVGEQAVQAAERIRSRLGDQNLGPRQIYLCHGFCEVGAVTLSSALADLRTFLVSNPGEVVIIINQDEGVAPADIERAFDQAGLLDLVYRGPFGPFPTLREMIDSGQRLVVMAENDAGDISWYPLAYGSVLQETPFTFNSAAQLTDPSQLAESCRSNRGPATAPLFLVNNWVDTTPVPRASLAAVVNARAALLQRTQTCQRIRHRLPNLVAVDFYMRGDVLGVVRALNGLSP